MRQIQLFAVVALAALVLVAWLIISDEPGQTAAAGGFASHKVASTTAVSPHPRASESSEDAERSATSFTSLAMQTSAGAAETTVERGLELIAVVGAARRRVTEVEMWWWEELDGIEPAGFESLDEVLQSGEFDAVLSERATRLAPDENGRFYAPSLRPTGYAIARAPGLFGYESVGHRSPSPCPVTLEQDTELRVRVVDEAGSAVAGVGVALRQYWGGDHAYDHGRTMTDADGIARLHHFRALIAGDWDFDARYCLAIAEPLGQEVAKFIDITRPPTELVELVLPAVGVVEVEILGAERDTWVALEVSAPDSGSDPERESFHDGRRRPEDGKVRFEFVGLGREVVVWTLNEHGGRAHVDQRCRGPRFAGQTVSVKLRLESARLQFVGRLVDESGNACANARFHAVLREPGPDDDGWAERTEGRSDANGRFEVEFARRTLNIGTLSFDVRDEVGAPLALGQHPITAAGADKPLELGDVQVRGIPVRFTGRVQDARGAAVPRAHVSVFLPRERHRGDGAMTRVWQPLWDANAWCDDDGRFTIRTSAKDPFLVLRARTPDARSAPVEFRAGERDVVLVLDEDGELSGRVLMAAAATPTDYLNVQVSRAAGETVALELSEYRGSEVDADGEFVVRGLPPGLYDVRVHLQGRDDSVANVPSVRVSAGVAARDPRLDPLDLRHVGDFVQLLVFDADGRFPNDIVRCKALDSTGAEFGEFWTPSGRMLLDRRDPAFWITAEHCQLELVDPAAVGPELRLRRAPRVRVVLEDGSPLPADDVQMEVSLHGVGEPEGLRECVEDTLTFDANHLAQGEVRRVGALAAVLWLHGNDSASLPAEFVGGNTVVDSPAVQTLTLRYSREAFEAALADARD